MIIKISLNSQDDKSITNKRDNQGYEYNFENILYM